ncbi:hypothetical protein OUZ56_003894 [Daphnia magna]|uniref:Uncharacterized protein n=1 Tax=Daphnia magna TaxID=35525 RepID=A0ABQ9YNH7_9CRUS|nr:hypothetical protein OUZ56_003894 [Daphnia magna]
MAGSGNYYYERPSQREYAPYGGGYPMPPSMPYPNAMRSNCMPAPMYQGAVPRIACQFPQSMFARERDGYLRDRAPCDDEDDEDIEAMTAQQEKSRYTRASQREADEDFESVKTQHVRPRPNRSAYLDDEGEFETVRTSTRPRINVDALFDDDGDTEPAMKLEDIEEDLRKLRQATTSALNRYTAKSNSQPSTRLSRFFATYLNEDKNYDRSGSSSSSYVRPSSLKPLDSSSYEPPMYDTRRSMYTSSRSTNKESDLENTTSGKREPVAVPQDYAEQAPQSRRRTPRTYEDDTKINSRIDVMSRYILSKNKAKN